MDPGYGVNLDRYVFENNNATLDNAIKYEVSTAIRTHERRVIVRTIDVTRNLDRGELTLTIQYIIKATRQDQSVGVSYR